MDIGINETEATKRDYSGGHWIILHGSPGVISVFPNRLWDVHSLWPIGNLYLVDPFDGRWEDISRLFVRISKLSFCSNGVELGNGGIKLHTMNSVWLPVQVLLPDTTPEWNITSSFHLTVLLPEHEIGWLRPSIMGSQWSRQGEQFTSLQNHKWLPDAYSRPSEWCGDTCWASGYIVIRVLLDNRGYLHP